jgi:hypothetical protein
VAVHASVTVDSSPTRRVATQRSWARTVLAVWESQNFADLAACEVPSDDHSGMSDDDQKSRAARCFVSAAAGVLIDARRCTAHYANTLAGLPASLTANEVDAASGQQLTGQRAHSAAGDARVSASTVRERSNAPPATQGRARRGSAARRPERWQFAGRGRVLAVDGGDGDPRTGRHWFEVPRTLPYIPVAELVGPPQTRPASAAWLSCATLRSRLARRHEQSSAQSQRIAPTRSASLQTKGVEQVPHVRARKSLA